MNDLKIGDYVRFQDYSTAMGEYSSEHFKILISTVLQIKWISYDKISFIEMDDIFNLINRWGYCPFQKDIDYTRKMKINKLLKNETV